MDMQKVPVTFDNIKEFPLARGIQSVDGFTLNRTKLFQICEKLDKDGLELTLFQIEGIILKIIDYGGMLIIDNDKLNTKFVLGTTDFTLDETDIAILSTNLSLSPNDLKLVIYCLQDYGYMLSEQNFLGIDV
jgi:hypothetical protein